MIKSLFIAYLIIFLIISCKTNRTSEKSKEYQTTTVSYYANKFNGKKTSSGNVYRHSKMTGAHTSLAFGTKVEITNIQNHKSVIITITDRRNLKQTRKFDLSQGAFKKIANLDRGLIKVKYRVLK